MGDSEKVWNVNADRFSASMAVKAVRVFVDGLRTAVQPVKLGDSTNTSKVTCDAALLRGEYVRIVEEAKAVKDAAIKQPHAQCTMDIDERFGCTIVQMPTPSCEP